jgi:DNA replication protein DnaC
VAGRRGISDIQTAPLQEAHHAWSITTNLPFKDWGQLFPSAAAASAIADRLVHRGILVRITGKSKRSDQEVE